MASVTGHPHKLYPMRANGVWECSSTACDSKSKAGTSVGRWHCTTTNKDFCERCMERQSTDRYEVQFQVHSAYLRRSFKVEPWKCDGATLPGGCKGEMTAEEPRYTTTTPGVAFNLCTSCIIRASPNRHPLHPHEMQFRGITGAGWGCDGRHRQGGCRLGGVTSTARRWRCASGCDYDLCGKCWDDHSLTRDAKQLTEPVPLPSSSTLADGPLPDRRMHPWHPHELVRNHRDNGWGCDGRRQSGGCRRGGGSTSGVPRFRCDSCDFDLCDACIRYTP